MKKGILGLIALLVAACGGEVDGSSMDERSHVTASLEHGELDGQALFEDETFDGNGRTCASCHREQTRTISPEQAQALFAQNPDDPLFQGDAADGFGQSDLLEVCVEAKDPKVTCTNTPWWSRCKTKVKAGITFECETSFKRFLTHATIVIPIDLHPAVSVLGSDGTVFLNRGVPTTLNTPALDPVLMYDGRAPTLQAQAADAFAGHAEVFDVSDDALDAIAQFEKTEFTSDALATFADGGPAPALPPGNTESEKRGRTFFTPPPAVGKEGFCALCHNGPMLDEVAVPFDLGPLNDEAPALAAEPGDRFSTAFVSDVNSMGNPVHVWTLTDENGLVRTIESPDIGQGAITGKWRDVNRFKIPTLWGTEGRAPYFHDNSAKTVEELVHHYGDFVAASFGVTLTPEDRADIIAYLKLL